MRGNIHAGFVRMQGPDNDYVYIDCFLEQVAKPEELATRITDHYFGVGSDGPILTCPSEVAPVRMRMFNADGSEGRMCGNGTRCVACYTYDHGLVTSRGFDIEMGVGIRHAGADESLVTIDMGETVLDGELEEAAMIGSKTTRVILVSVSNPHAVYLVDSPETLRGLDLDKAGPAYEHHPRFPEGVDSEFLYIKSPAELRMQAYECSSGEILAYGTSATVIASAAMRLGRANERVTVHLLDDDLMLEQLSNGYSRMTGLVVKVFLGSYFSE